MSFPRFIPSSAIRDCPPAKPANSAKVEAHQSPKMAASTPSAMPVTMSFGAAISTRTRTRHSFAPSASTTRHVVDGAVIAWTQQHQKTLDRIGSPQTPYGRAETAVHGAVARMTTTSYRK
jgi:hypothetical protein